MTERAKGTIIMILFYSLALITFCATKNTFSFFITFIGIPVYLFMPRKHYEK